MTVVGVDLGTTNTVVAAARGGRATTLKDETGCALLPSVVSFHPNGSVLVGAEAKERRTVDAHNTIFSVKRLIGRSWDNEQVQRARGRLPFSMKEGPGKSVLVESRNQAYTLAEISSFVLRRAKEVAEARLGQPVEECVITVPANFNDLQRAATKVAGRLAGLEVLRILNEPTAAALAYGFGKGGRERLAVFDFGGGTFDVTLLDLSENVFEVLATAGDTFLGGDDIDRVIAERMARALLTEHRLDAEREPQLFERLRAAAEDLKIELTAQEVAEVTLREVGHRAFGKAIDFRFRLTRAELENLTQPFAQRTLEVCREALGVAGLSVKDFDQLLLVGGSTRLPIVQRTAAAFWGRAPHGRIHPDEVVALGAAIQAAALGTSKRRPTEIPAAPVPAAGTLRPTPRSELPSWTGTEGAHRPRLTSIPPQTELDPPRPRQASNPSLPPTARRSDHSLLSRFDPRSSSPQLAPPPPPLAASPPIPGRPPAPADVRRTLLGMGVADVAPQPPPPLPPPIHLDDSVDLLDDDLVEPHDVPARAPARPVPAPPPEPRVPPPAPRALPPVLGDPPSTQPSGFAPPAPQVTTYPSVHAPEAAVEAPLLIDVTPLALGVEVVGGYCDTLIERNSAVPCERSREFVTARDAQTTVRVRVSQGQSERFGDNTLLGDLVLTGLRPAPRGSVTISVTFSLDESGILSVAALDTETGASTSAELKLLAVGHTS